MSWNDEFRAEIKQRKYIAKRVADWQRINKLPLRLKHAVLGYINGEFISVSMAATSAGYDKLGFIELLNELKVPVTG
jgi:hypothetical protein